MHLMENMLHRCECDSLNSINQEMCNTADSRFVLILVQIVYAQYAKCVSSGHCCNVNMIFSTESETTFIAVQVLKCWNPKTESTDELICRQISLADRLIQYSKESYRINRYSIQNLQNSVAFCHSQMQNMTPKRLKRLIFSCTRLKKAKSRPILFLTSENWGKNRTKTVALTTCALF